jgi:hypothetical protein
MVATAAPAKVRREMRCCMDISLGSRRQTPAGGWH